MKMKVVYYSYSGNTKEVSERLCNELIAMQLVCSSQEIHADEEDPKFQPKELTEIPDVLDYDVLVFASPVRAFGVSPIMKMYLEQLPSLKNKKVINFVTHQFPKPWLGGTQATKSIKRSLVEKEADVLATYVIDWSNKKREDQIDSMIASIKELVQK